MTNTKTGYKATILADSTNPSGNRVTTMLVTFPRQVLAEFNTHRVFSRNSASSRAIPVAKQLQLIWDNPYLPEPHHVGRNKPGMQAGELFTQEDYQQFIDNKRVHLHRAIIGAFEDLLGVNLVKETLGDNEYSDCLTNGFAHENQFTTLLSKYQESLKTKEHIPNPHKEVVSRYLEPYMWHEVIVTATEWDNFFALRTHPDADPKIRDIAVLMEEAYNNSTPTRLLEGQWHAPFLSPEEVELLQGGEEEYLLVAAGRCARLSYLTHHGKRDVSEDIGLAVKLEAHGHMSPFEHIATPQNENSKGTGNLVGWKQLRSLYAFEDNFKKKLEEMS